MWWSWLERQQWTHWGKGGMAQLIYIDHNMKSSCVPEPELIKKVQ